MEAPPSIVIPAVMGRDRAGLGGTASFVRGLDAGLRASGFRVTLLGCGPARDDDPTFISAVGREGARGRDLAWALWARRREWRFPPETILHLQRPDHALGFLHGPWPLVVTYHGRHRRTVMLRGGPLAGAFYRWIEDRAGRRADALTFVSRADLEAVVGARPAWRPKAHVVPVGIERDRFTPGDAGEARRALGLPPDVRAIVYAGRLEREKNVPALLHAAQRLPDVELWIAGTGREESRCRRIAGPRVRFLGPLDRDRLPLLLRAGDLVALASRHEGLPTIVLEAWACGCPVVAPPVGDLPVLMADGGGVLAPDARPDHLAEAFRTVLDARPSDPSQRAAEQDRLRRRTDRHAWDVVTQAYARVYAEAAMRRSTIRGAADGSGRAPGGAR
jgi:glycosyltransferase involved in cell wall biosynthesis